jgi:hypothetical protein
VVEAGAIGPCGAWVAVVGTDAAGTRLRLERIAMSGAAPQVLLDIPATADLDALELDDRGWLLVSSGHVPPIGHAWLVRSDGAAAPREVPLPEATYYGAHLGP